MLKAPVMHEDGAHAFDLLLLSIHHHIFPLVCWFDKKKFDTKSVSLALMTDLLFMW